MTSTPRPASLRGALLGLLLAAGADGANYYWDPDGDASASVGGTGTWDASSTQWRFSTSGGALSAWPNAGTDNDATFGNAVGTVTVSGPINVNDLTFAVGGMTLAGSGLTLVGATSNIDTTSGTTTFETAFAGAGTLNKSNTGTLLLKNAGSMFSGVIKVSGGQLHVHSLGNGGAASSLGASSSAASNLVIGGTGATLLLTTGVAAAQSTDRLFTLQGGAQITSNSGYAMTFSSSGDILHAGSGSRALTLGGNTQAYSVFNPRLTDNGASALTVNKTGGGRWVLGNSGNAFTGALAISAGRLGLANGGAAGGGNLLLANTNLSAYLEAHGDVTLGSSKTLTIGSTNATHTGFTAYLGVASATARTFDVQSRIVSATTTSGNSDIKLELAAPVAAGSVIRLSNATNSFTGQVVASGGVVEFVSVANGLSASALGAGAHAHALASPGELTWRYVGASAGSTDRSLNWSGAGNLRLESSGVGSVSWLGTSSLRSGTAGGQLVLAGSNTGANTLGQVVNDGTSAAVSLRKEGAGKWVLSAANTYTGGTTVAAGTLSLASGGSLGSGSLSVLSGGRLAGTGTVGVATTVSGVHAPGNSPGLQTFSAGLTYAAGSVFEWEFAGDALGTRGADYDAVDITSGVLGITSGAILKVINLDAIDYSSAEWSNFRTFTVFSLSGGATSSGSFTINQSLAGDRGPGYWFLTEDATGIQLNWSPVPEPSTYGLAIGALTLAVAAARRRQARRRAVT